MPTVAWTVLGAVAFWGLGGVMMWRIGTEPALRRTSEDGWRVAWDWPASLAGSHVLLLSPFVTYDRLVWGASVLQSVILVATGFRPGLMAKGYFNWDAQHDRALLRRGTIGQVALLVTLAALSVGAVLGAATP